MDQYDAWGDYAQSQLQSDRRKLDAKSWAAEEQANELLDAIANNTLKSAGNAREVWVENLATNRAKKHRRRAALLRKYQRKRPAWAFSEAHNLAVQSEGVLRIRQNTSSEEWRILWALAIGGDYESIAKAVGCTTAALKTRVSRCRRRLLLACG